MGSKALIIAEWAKRRIIGHQTGGSRWRPIARGRAKASALPVHGLSASRTGCLGSASDFRRLTNPENGAHPAPAAAYGTACDRPLADKEADAKLNWRQWVAQTPHFSGGEPVHWSVLDRTSVPRAWVHHEGDRRSAPLGDHISGAAALSPAPLLCSATQILERFRDRSKLRPEASQHLAGLPRRVGRLRPEGGAACASFSAASR
jgi:hypothetical protein